MTSKWNSYMRIRGFSLYQLSPALTSLVKKIRCTFEVEHLPNHHRPLHLPCFQAKQKFSLYLMRRALTAKQSCSHIGPLRLWLSLSNLAENCTFGQRTPTFKWQQFHTNRRVLFLKTDSSTLLMVKIFKCTF